MKNETQTKKTWGNIGIRFDIFSGVGFSIKLRISPSYPATIPALLPSKGLNQIYPAVYKKIRSIEEKIYLK